MKKFGRWLFLILASTTFYAGCNKGIEGELKENLLPETYLTADTIVRSGEDRFVSQIDISWSGTDADGAVVGYEYSVDGKDWGFTKRQDSSFLIELPVGKDTFDVDFRVRAVDNRGGVDPTPASLIYPVKNSAPEVSFVYQTGGGGNPSRNPTKTFPILKLEWEATDRDGPTNLDYLELVINDTTAEPYKISPDFSTAVLEAVNPEAESSNCRVLLGSALALQKEELEGMVLNDTNVVYIRAVDKVGVKSHFSGSRKVFLKRKVSDVLLVNAYGTSFSARENFYLKNLQAVGITDFDTLRVNEEIDFNLTSLAADNPTQERIFAMFETLIWFGDDVPYLLTLAQRTTGEFLDKGGKMFISAFFNSGIDPQSQYLDFTPIDSLVGSFFIDNGAEITPAESGWPVLASNKIISGVRPFYEIAGSSVLYDAKLTKPSGPWKGKSTIMAEKSDAQGNVQFVICSVELYRLSGNGNMEEFFRKMFVEEFGL